MKEDRGRLKVAHDALSRGDFTAALEAAEKLLQGDEDDVPALYVKTLAQSELEQFEAARETIERLLVGDPDDPKPYLLRAAIALGLDEPQAAHEDAQKATELAPEDPVAWGALAEISIYRREYAEAVEAAERACAHAAQARPYALTLARARTRNDEPEEAKAALDQVLADEPDHVEALTLKANASQEGGEHSEARALIDRAFELAPNSKAVLWARGRLLALFGDYEEAGQSYSRLTETEPEAEDAWLGLGLVYVIEGKDEQALHAVQRAAQLAPERPDIKRWLGSVLREMHSYPEALRVFTELVEDDQAPTAVWREKGIVERELGFSSDSIESLRRGLSLDGFKEPFLWRELALSYSKAGLHGNAWSAFSEAEVLAPESLDILVGKAVEAIWEHNESQALAELLQAEERHGPDALIEFNRGVAHYRLGREQRACQAWKRAVDLDPELTAAEVLIEGLGTQSNLGGWVEHWFRASASWKRRAGGAALLLGLAIFLVLPSLEPELIPGVRSGTTSLTSYIPAFVFLFLLVLPTVRGLSVGSVALDVAPLQSSAGEERPAIDKDQVIPVLEAEDLDIRRLVIR